MSNKLIKPYRHTGDNLKAVQFPVYAVCLATPEQLTHLQADVSILTGPAYPEGYPMPVFVQLAQEFGQGLVLGPSMDESLTAAQVIQDVFPEHKALEIVPYMIPDIDNLMTLRRQFDRAGHPSKGYYSGLQWPGPKWFFNPWNLMQRPEISRN